MQNFISGLFGGMSQKDKQQRIAEIAAEATSHTLPLLQSQLESKLWQALYLDSPACIHTLVAVVYADKALQEYCKSMKVGHSFCFEGYSFSYSCAGKVTIKRTS